MADLASLITRVSSRLKDKDFTAVSRDEIIQVINDAVGFYAKRKFWFNDVSQNVTLNVGDPVLPALSVPLRYIYNTNGIVINYSSNRYEVNKITGDEYDMLNVEGQGIPFAYTYRNGGYELYYFPDADYIAVVRGLKAYDPLVNDTDTNDFTDEAENLIAYEAISRASAEFRQDDKMEAYYFERARNEESNLKRETRALMGSGRNQIEDF